MYGMIVSPMSSAFPKTGEVAGCCKFERKMPLVSCRFHSYLRGWGESGETLSVGGFAEQNLRECTPKFSSGQTHTGGLSGTYRLFIRYKGIYSNAILWYSLCKFGTPKLLPE